MNSYRCRTALWATRNIFLKEGELATITLMGDQPLDV
jgi:hypothetical protein